MISLRSDWFDLLAVQGTLKSLQHYNSKALILQHSAFFTVQLSFIYAYWKNHSFDYTNLCQHNDVSACIKFLSSGLASGGSHTKMLTHHQERGDLYTRKKWEETGGTFSLHPSYFTYLKNLEEILTKC